MAEYERTDEFETESEWENPERETPRGRPVTLFLMVGCIALALLFKGVTSRRVARAYAPDAPAVPAPPPVPALGVDEVEALHDAFTRGDFAALDRALAWDAAEARRDAGYEHRHRIVLDLFDRDDPRLRPALDAWIAQTPTSPGAHLARASHFTAMGWAARGHAFASKTSQRQFGEMGEWFALAASDIATAKRLDSTNVMVYWLHLGLIPGGDVDRSAVLEQGLRQLPGSLLLRTRIQHYRRPRWSSGSWRGAIADMLAFADESDEAARTNPRLRVIRGYVPFDSAESLHRAGREREAVEMYSRALRHGDHWVFRLGRADAYFYSKQWQLAKDDYDAVLAERPTDTEARARRAASCMRLYWNAPAGAERDAMMQCMSEDIRIASKLDPTDSDLGWILKRNPYLERFVSAAPAAVTR